MYQYQCEICKKYYVSDNLQKNTICNECKEKYSISQDYINGIENNTDNQNTNENTIKAVPIKKQHKPNKFVHAFYWVKYNIEERKGIVFFTIFIFISLISLIVKNLNQQQDVNETVSETTSYESNSNIETQPNHQESQINTEANQSTDYVSPSPAPRIVKISASYSGSTEAGVILNSDNEDISVTAEYDDGTKQNINFYQIALAKKLKPGKTSTVKITYDNFSCKLSVKCTSPTKAQLKRQYKKQCKYIPYKKLARRPKKYDGKKVKFTGKIAQVIEGSYLTSYRIAVTKKAYDYWDDYVYVDYYGDSSERLLEDDIVSFYGKYDGIYTYESVFGARISIPSVEAEYIERHK